MPTISQISMVTSSFTVRSISHYHIQNGAARCAKRQWSQHECIHKYTHTHTDLEWTHTKSPKVELLRYIEWLDELFQTSLLMR